MNNNRSSNCNISVIILTFNEEDNLPQALASVSDWAKDVFILDSGSTDRTIEIAESYNCKVFTNQFENYAKQRNYAIEKLPITTKWIFFLDADEWLTEDLKKEITETILRESEENGFYIKRRLIWMDRWIKRGYYPTWILRLFRKGYGRCEDRQVNEHLIVDGKIGYLQNDIIHEDRKPIGDWIAKHNSYAEREAQELFRKEGEQQEIVVSFGGSQSQRKRWLRYRIWNKLPPLIRPFFYFIYRYILRGGFLDGKAGLIYHFMQALWFLMLIDIKYLEMKHRIKKKTNKNG